MNKLKKKVILVAIIMVVLLLNLDCVLVIDDYFKAAILFAVAGFLIIFEYRLDKSSD